MSTEFWGLWPALLCFLGLPVIIALYIGTGFLHQARLQRVFRGAVFDRVLPLSVRIRRTWRDAFLVLAIACLIVALAEPRLGKVLAFVKQTGVDMVLVVDLSRSMDAEDVDPSRLERVKREIEDLVDVLQQDRVGLVIYAGGAFPRMPLSTDHQALVMLTREMSTDNFQVQGSELGLAIREAMALLRTDVEGAGKAILVFSDGEIHDPGDALVAAGDAAQESIRIYTVGVGNEPAPIPVGNGRWVKDGSGRTVMSTPSPDVLKEIARATGGAYVQSVAAATDMKQLYQDQIRQALKAADGAMREKEMYYSGYQWPLALGLVLALLGLVVGEGRRRWGAAGAVILAIGLALPQSALAGSVIEADRLYRDGKYREAVEMLTEVSLDRPNDPDVYRRLGAARYRAGDYEGASRAWDMQRQIEGDSVETLYNSGNAEYRSGRYLRAKERFEEVLDSDPDHPGAKRNLDIVEQAIQVRRALQPPPPPDSGGEDGEQGDGEQGDEGQAGDPKSGSQDPQQGEQQEGQQPEQGEGEGEGEPDEEGSQPPPSGGQAQGEQQPTNRTGDGEQKTGEDGGQRKGTQEHQEAPEGETGTGDPDQLQGESGEPGEPAAGADPEEGQPFTSEQAEKFLDGVEEGRPHFRVPGNTEGKPW